MPDGGRRGRQGTSAEHDARVVLTVDEVVCGRDGLRGEARERTDREPRDRENERDGLHQAEVRAVLGRSGLGRLLGEQRVVALAPAEEDARAGPDDRGSRDDRRERDHGRHPPVPLEPRPSRNEGVLQDPLTERLRDHRPLVFDLEHVA